MTKWFYRAVGTVGVAGGFLLLAGGAAQADDAPVNDLRGSLDGFFHPMGPSALAGGTDPAAPLSGLANLTLGGRAVNPTDTLGALPLDPAATIDPSKLGATAPAAGATAPTGTARDASDTAAPDPAAAAPAPAPAAPAGDLLGGLPLGGDLLGGLPVGGGLLGGLPVVGGAAPAAAPAASEAGGGVSTVSGLPVASTLPALGDFHPELPSVQNFDAGQLLPALIGDALSAQQAERFPTEADPLASIPLVGDVMLAGALAPPPAAADAPGADTPAGAPAAGGPLAGLPLLGSLGSLTGGGAAPGGATAGGAIDPAPAQPAPAGRPAPTPRPATSPKFSDPAISPTADNDRTVGRHRAMSQSPTERPVAGEDADFTESARVPELEAPALNLPLPLVGNLGNLGGLLGGGAAPVDPAAAPAPSDLGVDPNGGPTSVMDV